MLNDSQRNWLNTLEAFVEIEGGASFGRIGGSDFEALAYETIQAKSKFFSIPTAFHSRGFRRQHISRTMELNGFYSIDRKKIYSDYAEYLHTIESSVMNLKFNFYAGKPLIDFIDRSEPFWAGNTILGLAKDRPLVCYDIVEDANFFLNSIKPLLNGKRLLVVSPFSRSVEFQHSRSARSVKGFDWPEFQLVTLDSPVTYSSFGKSNGLSRTWSEQLKNLNSEIKNLDFDLAFLSCGSYANPIASSIQNGGRKAIYIGGMLNVFFNLAGGRFTQKRYADQLYEDSQIVPLEFHDLRRQSQGSGYSRKFEAMRAYLPEGEDKK